MAKAAGASCNMRCSYCYYLEKDKDFAPQNINKNQMSEELLELYIKQYILAQPFDQPVVFTWHGGEALLRPIKFYERALALQERYAFGRKIENCIQTNGLLLNEAWCRFFHDNNFLVGLSLDGNEEQHNRYRQLLRGGASFAQVIRGLNLLKRFNVEFNILSTINNFNADQPLEYYRFLRGIGIKYLQFTPIVERYEIGAGHFRHSEAPYLHQNRNKTNLFEGKNVRLSPYSVRPEQWGDFLCEVFDEWVSKDVGEVFVQLFETTLANWIGYPSGLCSFAETCGHTAIIEHNGEVFSCDHFVYPRYSLGNIQDRDLKTMMNSNEQVRFGLAKKEALTNQCKECLYLFACNGECPKNRFAYSQDNEAGHNYLCRGYYQFWEHITPQMDYMKSRLLSGKSVQPIKTE